MNILLTGAAGFIGSHLAERLLADGHSVTGLDNFDPYYDPRIKRRNIETAQRVYGGQAAMPVSRTAGKAGSHAVLLASSEGGAAGQSSASEGSVATSPAVYRLIEGDVGERSLFDRILPEGRFDLVIHLAAQAGVRPSLVDPQKYERVNVTHTITLLEAMRTHGPRRLVAASSSSVYGNVTPAPFREDAACLQPQSPYGASKRAAEIYMGLYAQLYSFRIVIVRPFTVYGPRQRPDMAIAQFARKILLGETITLYGDGSTARDYTYVGDIVEGLMGAVVCPAPFGIYNLGGEHPVTLKELIALLEKAIGKKAQLRYEPLPPGDVERTSADLTHSRKDLCFSPAVPLEEGLRRTVAWVKEELAREGRSG